MWKLRISNSGRKTSRLRRRALVLGALAAAIACAADRPPPATAGSGSPALPAVTLGDLDGKPIGLTELTRGRVSVVDLWASWCDACRAEHEALDRMQRAYGKDGLFIVAVNQGEDPEYVRRYALAQGFTYPVLLDPDFALSRALGETALPVLLVIDRTGGIAYRTNKLDYQTLATVRRELGGSAAPAPEEVPSGLDADPTLETPVEPTPADDKLPIEPAPPDTNPEPPANPEPPIDVSGREGRNGDLPRERAR